jgi:hypothetical protein
VDLAARRDRPVTGADDLGRDPFGHRSLSFGDADDDAQGKVLSLRRDGDYGLVEAA